MTVVLPVSDDVIQAIAEVVLARVIERLPDTTPWMTPDEAAEHLRIPKSRIYKLVSRGVLPHHKDASRLYFNRDELDSWAAAQ